MCGKKKKLKILLTYVKEDSNKWEKYDISYQEGYIS